MRFFASLFFFSLLISSCSDSNVVGLELQPNSDLIEIFNSNIIANDSLVSPDSITLSTLSTYTESEDSLRSDETSSLVLGGINDPVFGYNRGEFLTQILLAENNIDLGNTPLVDSVVLTYNYSGYYGDINTFDDIKVYHNNSESIFKDSLYYSNSLFDLSSLSNDLVNSFNLSSDTSSNPQLKIVLNNSIGQQILDLGNSGLSSNDEFLLNFPGFFYATSNTSESIVYLNPNGTSTGFKVYYHNSISDSLSLDFILDGDVARVNLFNEKLLDNLSINNGLDYIQSMSGYKCKIELEGIDYLSSYLSDMSINKATLSFNVTDFDVFQPHEKLFLVRENNEGSNVFLSDFTLEGDDHFGGMLNGDLYEFNITRYFHKILSNPLYTNKLYLISSGGSTNANRTIILSNSVKISLLYSDL